MTGVERLFVEESEPALDPWDPPRTASKLDTDLLNSLIARPVNDLGDATAALALVNLADSELRAYGTDSSNKLRDPEIRIVLRALRATAARVGVTIEIPFRDFEGFRSYWNRNNGSGSWQARRDMLDAILGDAFTKLEDLVTGAHSPDLPQQSLANLRDPSAILDNLTRIQRAITSDPAQAVGSSKELIESTAKVVLIERGEPINDNMDLPELVKKAQLALRLHPSQSTPGPDGTDAVKKILGGASAIAIGVAELRNRGYGTGHGAARQRVGLSARHAHLAVNAALTWCQLMLDTLADDAAPWRASPS